MSDAQAHPAFEWVRSTPIPALHVELQEYRHRSTGARHLHIWADDPHNAFLVAFPTVPQDSTGVAHILEHTALCGSERYPVRDPFFMMLRRSLNTFMNAFTAGDWTAYPFASQNRKDFGNLLRVYLDAAFFPRLDPLDFAQEGHRVEFAKPDDPTTELLFKGVVYNEMKGAMSSPVTVLWQSLCKHIFPSITYHHNSGGDPADIPKLTHEKLKAFHAAHYHPSNAVFMTYGDIPAVEQQGAFEELALERFSREELDVHVPDEQRYEAPVAVEEAYAVDGADASEKTHIVLSWLLGRNTEPEAVLTAHLLSGVLLDNSAAPLRHALETTELACAPSPLCGLDDSMREMVFACGVEGSEPEHVEAVEALVLGVLHQVAEQGIPLAQVEAVLHQLELSQREIGGDHFPYGLQLMMNALTPALHGGDAAAALDIDPVLARLRERIKDPAYVPGLVRELLLDNPHRVRLTLRPDAGLASRREAEEQARLAEIRARLTAEDERRIVQQAEALVRRQQHKDDPDVLPRVGLSDIPRELRIPQGHTGSLAGMPATWFGAATNGLVYLQLVVDLPELDDEMLDLLPVFCDCVTEVGSGGRDYLSTQDFQSAVSGGIGARLSARAATDDIQRTRGVFVLSTKALARNQVPAARLLRETFQTPRFDELRRLRELIAQTRAESEQSVTDRGHILAMLAAAGGVSPAAALAQRWDGMSGIRNLKALDRALEQTGGLPVLAARLERLRAALLDAPRQLLLVSEPEQRDPLIEALHQAWGDLPAPNPGTPALAPSMANGAVREGWSASTQVNYCARAYPAAPADDPDGPALAVLAEMLRNGYLHRAIREQGGAYGGGANYDSDSGAFRFFSYRDPRLSETLADFDRAVEWVLQEPHEWSTVEEAILGVVSKIDRPASPAGEARRAFHEALHGRTPEQRQRFRARVLEVGLEDLRRVAAAYLDPERASTAVLSNHAKLQASASLGLEIREL
jgi:presequence protease